MVCPLWPWRLARAKPSSKTPGGERLAAEELARALINSDDAASSTLKQLIDDALVTTAVASRFLGRTTVTWGEGLGGSQALFTAALLPKEVSTTMALNPLFADNATTLRTVVGCGDTPQSDAAIDAVGLLDSACAAELVACACAYWHGSAGPERSN